jgi:pyridoxal phosphate enzyme (YggS family)
MNMTDVVANLAEVRERIAAAARAAARDPAAVTLVAVSKEVDAAAVRAALAAGQLDFGENRAQELEAKAGALAAVSPAPRWHFIGRIQRNKVRALAAVVSLWQSVDRAEVGEEIARRAPGARVLVQVNVGREPQKGGCPPGDTAALVERLTGLGLAVDGLMTVPPQLGDPRPHFARLRELADGLGLSTLSMGMSGDYEAAIAEGATVVRIGTAVFGARPPVDRPLDRPVDQPLDQ